MEKQWLQLARSLPVTTATSMPTAGHCAWLSSKQPENSSSAVDTIGILCNKGKEEMNEWGHGEHVHYSQYLTLESVRKTSHAHVELFNEIPYFKKLFVTLCPIQDVPVNSFRRSCFSDFPGIKAWGWFLSPICSVNMKLQSITANSRLSESGQRQNKPDGLQAAFIQSILFGS